MKTAQEIDAFARDYDPAIYAKVYGASAAKQEKRTASLFRDLNEPDQLRALAGQVKQHTLDHLDEYLEKAVGALEKNGVHCHFAEQAEDANAAVRSIMEKHQAKRLVKSKSMLTEETHLVPYLEKYGLEAVESDLGEFIIQLDHDHPTHIVTPIIHKDRFDVAKTFQRERIGDYTEDPGALTMIARNHLRKKYLDADVGLTGANFLSAESGRVVLVTNEGNARFSIAANRVLIVMVGIEKLVPRDKDLALLLNLIARSGTGQELTVYQQFINGPRTAQQPDGPDEMHVVFVDNRRSEVLGGDCREILRCIRCGACLNVCPIFRQVGGHGYRSVYPGPVGAVLSPLLAGSRFPEFSDLPKASSLCGACNEVCPVDIPIPDLLLRLRDKAKQSGAKKAMEGTPAMGLWAIMATQPGGWKTALGMGRRFDWVPKEIVPHPSIQAWTKVRKLPPFRGGKFREWMRSRN